MRILHLNDYALPMGGPETYLAALIDAQKAVGHEVALLATDSRGGGTLATFPSDAEPFVQPYGLAKGTTSSSKFLRALRQLYSPSARLTAAAVLRGFRPELVHVHMYLGQLSTAVMAPFRKARIPLVHTSHTYKIACPESTRMLPDGRYCRYPVGRACAGVN